LVIPHPEQRLLVSAALDFDEEIRQFFSSGQWTCLFRNGWLRSRSLPGPLPARPARVRGILANHPARASKGAGGPEVLLYPAV